MLKKIIKKFLLKKKNINIDFKSSINYSVVNKGGEKPINIINSKINISELEEGVFLENVTGYGDIKLGRFASISGPGTVLHAENNCIKIGAFSSIAQNVSIQEFNHDYNKPTSYAINFGIFNMPFTDDTVSHGDIILEEDVWIGSNVTILSGIRIGRGCVIGAGSVVTKDIPKYSIAFGNPAKIYKKRFPDNIIEFLEDSKWWEWEIEKIEKNKDFFNSNLNSESLTNVKNSIVY